MLITYNTIALTPHTPSCTLTAVSLVFIKVGLVAR